MSYDTVLTLNLPQFNRGWVDAFPPYRAVQR